MKVKLLNDPYISWEGMKGKVVQAFREKHSGRVYASIAHANSLGATDSGGSGNDYRVYHGYRYLMNSEFEVVEEDKES